MKVKRRNRVDDDITTNKKTKKRIKFKEDWEMYLPLFLVSCIIIMIIFGFFQNIYLREKYINDESQNYQIISNGENIFAFKKAYSDEGQIIIEPWVQINNQDQPTDDDVKEKLYYQMKFEDQNGDQTDVVMEGYLSNEEIVFNENLISDEDFIRFDIYEIKDVSELKYTTPTSYIKIDTEIIYEKINIKNFLKNPDEYDLEDSLNYINFNYLNHTNLDNSTDKVDEFFDEYYKMNEKNQLEYLQNLIINSKEMIEIEINLIKKSNITDQEIKNFLRIKSPYSEYIPISELQENYNDLIKYNNELLNEEIYKLEKDLEEKGVDLTEYYYQKTSVSQYEQIDYLRELE